MPFAFFPAGAAQCNAMVKGTVITDLCRFANHHTHTVIDKKTTPDGGPGVNFNAGKPARHIGQHPRQPHEPITPQHMTGPVHQHGVKARIGGDHLETGARGRVAVKDDADIFPNVFEHLRIRQ